MQKHQEISFEGVGGVTPAGSTMADVIAKLGHPDMVVCTPEEMSDGIRIRAKTHYRYTSIGLTVVFNGDGALDDGTPVGVVLAQEGSPLCTVEGLKIGMSQEDALAVVARSYVVDRSRSFVTYVLRADGGGDTELGLGFDDGCLSYIGLYRT